VGGCDICGYCKGNDPPSQTPGNVDFFKLKNRLRKPLKAYYCEQKKNAVLFIRMC
jgi:hypothetical protein